MQTFYFTDPGKVRSHNEDSVTILNNENNDLSNKVLNLINVNEKYVAEIDSLKLENKKSADENKNLKGKIKKLFQIGRKLCIIIT